MDAPEDALKDAPEDALEVAPEDALPAKFDTITPSAASTLLESDRSPITLRNGPGRSLTSVGAAMIWAATAASGCR